MLAGIQQIATRLGQADPMGTLSKIMMLLQHRGSGGAPFMGRTKPNEP
jgi:hypothetical protein